MSFADRASDILVMSVVHIFHPVLYFFSFFLHFLLFCTTIVNVNIFFSSSSLNVFLVASVALVKAKYFIGTGGWRIHFWGEHKTRNNNVIELWRGFSATFCNEINIGATEVIIVKVRVRGDGHCSRSAERWNLSFENPFMGLVLLF